jgi:hypothetical protein
MRHRVFALEEENQMLAVLDTSESKDPKKNFEKITQTRSVFRLQDVDYYMNKHIFPDEVSSIRDLFWNQEEIVQLEES